MNELYTAILNTLRATNGMAIDDHMSHKLKLFEQMTKIKAIAIYRDHIVAVDPAAKEDYSINDLYVDHDGMVHISRNQVGVVPKTYLNGMVEKITFI